MSDSDLALSSDSALTYHRTDSVLHDSDLLALLLAPDLEDSLTPGALVGIDNVALFRLLPLILVAINRIGETQNRRQSYVKLVSVLRMRIAACRGLKLRFLLTVTNPLLSSRWNVKLVHRKDCYKAAKHVLDQLARDMESQNELNDSLQMVQQLSTLGSTDSKLVDGWHKDKDTLIAFAAKKLLHPTNGIRTRTIKWHMRPIKAAFYGTELVDGIMERANFHSRKEAVTLAQKLMELGVIQMMGHHHHFKDDRRKIYQCRFALQRIDANHCRVVTDSGDEISSWEILECGHTIKQIEIQMPMDMIDLQSFEFWTSSVYVKGVEKGHRYGYRAIAHPLYCGGLDPGNKLDLTSLTFDDPGQSAYSNNVDDADTSDSNLASFHSSISTDEINELQQDGSVVASVVVKKVFASIARPMIIDLRVPLENANLDDDNHHVLLPPGILVKEGDNLAQDMSVELMFRCFNHIWERNTTLTDKYGPPPFSLCYEVFPTSPTQGFMEAVTGLVSLKEYDWQRWKRLHGNDSRRIHEMVRSTVGSYIGAYICGGRDRHFDNVLVKDDLHLLHIDFGFLMGTSPPIDGPRIAIAPQMESVFKDLKVWDKFVDMFVDAFLVLRVEAPAIIRTSVLIFSKAGYEEEQIRNFLQGKFSLNVHEKEKKAADLVRKQLLMSSGDIKTKFKAFAHEHIDPAWYGLLEKGFPPAVAIMKIVDMKEQKATKKLSESSSSHNANISDDHKIKL